MRLVCLMLIGLIILAAGCKPSAPNTPPKPEPAKAAVHDAAAPNDPITTALNHDRVVPPVATATPTTAGMLPATPPRAVVRTGPGKAGPRAITVASTVKAAPGAVAVSAKRATHAKPTAKAAKATSAKGAVAKKKKVSIKALAKKKGAKAKTKAKAKAAHPKATAVKRPVRQSPGVRDVTVVAGDRAKAMPATREPKIIT